MSHSAEPVIEVAVYTVHDAAEGRRARDEAYDLMQTLPGFVAWNRLVSGDDPTHLADVVQWASHDDARNASEQVRTDARFAPFVASIDQIISFHHYDQQT
jgi:hypothetical protein